MALFSAADIGARVTVRIRKHPGYVDVVGELVACDDRGLVIRRRGGRDIEAGHGDVVAGHVVPPRSDAAGRVPDEAVEAIAARGWRGRETTHLGSWLLRAADGWTGRANSVLPLGDSGGTLGEALEHVTAWYAARGLPARFQVPLPLCAALDAELDARGWPAYNPTIVLASDLGPVLRALPADDTKVDVAAEPNDDWLATYHYRGGTVPDVARAVLVDADQPAFASLHDGDAVVAIGRAVVDERWCGITALEVAETHRRRGLAHIVLRALLQWAGTRGARHIYLQVAADNDPALTLYRRLGVGVHHRYHYRLAPSP